MQYLEVLEYFWLFFVFVLHSDREDFLVFVSLAKLKDPGYSDKNGAKLLPVHAKELKPRGQSSLNRLSSHMAEKSGVS